MRIGFFYSIENKEKIEKLLRIIKNVLEEMGIHIQICKTKEEFRFYYDKYYVRCLPYKEYSMRGRQFDIVFLDDKIKLNDDILYLSKSVIPIAM